MNRNTDGWTVICSVNLVGNIVGQTDRWTERQMEQQTDRWTERQMKQKNKQMDRKTD